MKIALAQMNPVVGDLEGNAGRITDLARQAAEAGAALLGDTILHKAGYTIREAAEDAMECARKEKSRILASSRNEASSSGL